MTVIPPIFDGVELSDGQDGFSYTAPYYVKDIDNAASLIDLMYKAATASGIPQRGDPSGDLPGLFVVNRRVSVFPPQDATVFVTFGAPTYRFIPQDTTRLEGASSISQVNTELDRDGNPLIVDYRPVGGQWQGPQTGSAPKFIINPQLRFTSREDDSPEWELLDLVGRRNSDQWRGHPAGSWLYADCQFSKEGSDTKYTVTRVFVGDPYDSFEPVIRWVDPQTGRPPAIKKEDVPAALDEGNGIVVIPNLYFEFDFNDFGFNGG